MEIRSQLPEHPVPDEVRSCSTHPTIRVDGLVAREMLLDADAFAKLPHGALEEPFACEEGWTVPGLRWGGVALVDVLARAQPVEQARFVHVHAGGYTIALSLERVSRVLICDTLDGLPLSIEHGGPWRLVVPAGPCFSSVKWVDRLEVLENEPTTTAERIARSRLASPQWPAIIEPGNG